MIMIILLTHKSLIYINLWLRHIAAVSFRHISSIYFLNTFVQKEDLPIHGFLGWKAILFHIGDFDFVPV